MSHYARSAGYPARRTLTTRIGASSAIVAVIATALTFMGPLVSSATDPIADINLGTAASFSSVSTGALTVGAGAAVAGSAVVGEGAQSTVGAGSAVGAAVAGIAQAQTDIESAYNDAASRTPTALILGDIGGQTFLTGVYQAGAAISSTGAVTLDAQGNPDAVFIFQIGAAFNQAASTTMVLVNGAQARHVYWQILGAVTIGASATFVGTIIAKGAVTAGAETQIAGRTFSTEGAVSLGAGMQTLGVPEISLTNNASPTGVFFDGETVTYMFVAANSGNVALAVDPLTLIGVDAISPLTYVWSGVPGTLLPKESVTATGTYRATFADAVKRSLTATAGVGGMSFSNGIGGSGADAIQVIAVRSKTVTVWPIPVVDSVSVIQGVPTSFDVYSNDQPLAEVVGFSRTQLTTTPRPIGAAESTVPAAPLFGNVTCSDTGQTRGSCTYTSAELFTGTDGFDYSVSQLGRSWNVHVTVSVAAAPSAPIAQNDRAVATTGGPSVEILPLLNDTTEGPGTLALLAVNPLPAGQGVLTCTATNCSYVPPTNGFVGSVVTQYVVADQGSGAMSAPSSFATITIFVDAAPLTRQGFTSSPRTAPSVDAGVWTETSDVVTPTAHCVSGRPETSFAWTPSSRATSWTIERKVAAHRIGNADAGWKAIAVVPGSTTSFIDDRVGESNNFQYRVRPDLYLWEGVFSDASTPSTTPNAASAAGC